MADNLDGKGTQLVILAIGKRLTGGYHNRLARMDAKGVEILHVTDGDAVVVFITHYLVFYLFPTL